MNKVSNELKSIISSVTEPELIQKLAGLNKLVEEEDIEYKTLMDKHLALQKDYRDAVLHSSFKDEPNNDIEPPKPIDFMDVVNKILN